MVGKQEEEPYDSFMLHSGVLLDPVMEERRLSEKFFE